MEDYIQNHLIRSASQPPHFVCLLSELYSWAYGPGPFSTSTRNACNSYGLSVLAFTIFFKLCRRAGPCFGRLLSLWRALFFPVSSPFSSRCFISMSRTRWAEPCSSSSFSAVFFGVGFFLLQTAQRTSCADPKKKPIALGTYIDHGSWGQPNVA